MRVSLSKAKGYKRRKVFYRCSNGDLARVKTVERKRPNWRLVLEDGRDFLVDPSTVLETE